MKKEKAASQVMMGRAEMLSRPPAHKDCGRPTDQSVLCR